MNKSAANAFINQVLVYTLVMLVFTGSIGFGTVWLRHEISLAANRNKNLRTHLAEVQRHLDQLIAEIAAAQSPDALIRLDSSMRLGLDMPRQEQIQRVPGDVEQQLAARRNPDLFVAEIQPAGFRRGGTR
jgi:predicted NBD/HSP70 family sugar kinase